MSNQSGVRPPDSATEKIDLSDFEFTPPCDSRRHERFDIPAQPAEWIVLCVPKRGCGCPTISRAHLWCDPCLQSQISGPKCCPKCGSVEDGKDSVISWERLDRIRR